MNNIIEKLKSSRLAKSIIRHGNPDNDLDRSLLMNNNFFLHLHPVKINKHGLKFNYTFGLGGISFFLFLILVITGGLLMFYYIPSTEKAYKSVLDIVYTVPYGRIIRNMHRWAAQGMVVAVLLHMCRVFFTGSFKEPREFNWVIGVFLFVLTLGLSFTGYLLPWDQLAFWAITVGSDMAKGVPIIGEEVRFLLLGGNIVDQNALIRFYTLHVFILPALAVILMFVHFWRVRKDGGISSPKNTYINSSVNTEKESQKKTYTLMTAPKNLKITYGTDKEPDELVMTYPNLLIMEIIAGVIVFLLLLLMSVYFNAPLEELANPLKTPNPAKSPWYFIALQEIVSHTTAFWGGFFIPAAAIIILMAVPYIKPDHNGVGVWFARERKKELIVFASALGLAILLTIIGQYFRGPGWSFVLPF
ncbi:MAG: cytochrome b N-terminal domain-containing protein [Bacteroidetes bacterium]|nr:cytochrome b N-terminal domain-containing protein [Bacteroidota bacterium]